MRKSSLTALGLPGVKSRMACHASWDEVPGFAFPSTAPEDLRSLSHFPPELSLPEFALSFLITCRTPETATAAAILGPWIYEARCLSLAPA